MQAQIRNTLISPPISSNNQVIYFVNHPLSCVSIGKVKRENAGNNIMWLYLPWPPLVAQQR